jgi:YggT family protein
VNSGTDLVNMLLQVLSLAILARALLSFLDPMVRNSVSRLLVDLTEPIVGPIRRIVPPIGGSIDISPIIALFLLQIIREMLSRS